MKLRDIPVTVTGPGSQPPEPDDTHLEFISMPKEMDSYRAPDIPEPDKVQHLQGAKAVTDWLAKALSRLSGRR